MELPQAQGRILFLPFKPLGTGNDHDWIGRAVQQSLEADLGRSLPGVASGSEQSAADASEAVKAAAGTDVRFVVFGSYQNVNALSAPDRSGDRRPRRPLRRRIEGDRHDRRPVSIGRFAVDADQAGRRCLRIQPAQIRRQSRGGLEDMSIEPSGPVRIGPAGEPPSAAEEYAGVAQLFKRRRRGRRLSPAYSNNAHAGAAIAAGALDASPSTPHRPGSSIYELSLWPLRLGIVRCMERSVSSFSSGIGPGQPTPAPIFGATLFQFPSPGRGSMSSGGGGQARSRHHGTTGTVHATGASHGHGRR